MSDYEDSAVEIEFDDDSDYASGSDYQKSPSLGPSIHEYFEQNGRRYHTYFGPDKNPLPNDEPEHERLDLMHEILLFCTGKIVHAPLEKRKAQHVLDLGTGTGVWAVDFAQEYPDTQVLGIDLSPVRPAWIPSNCHFEIDDFEAEWMFQQKFDFINARTIAQSVDDWPRLIAQAKRNLAPGGWLELGEAIFTPKSDDGSLPADWPPALVFGYVREAMVKLGRALPHASTLRRQLEDIGFVDIHVKRFKIPVGVWPKKKNLKQAGALALETTKTGYESYALNLCTSVLGMSVEETAELCKKAMECHHARNHVHMYFDYAVVYGRNP